MKIAIVTDHLAVYGGAEKVLKEMINVFPEADIFTTISTVSDEVLRKIGIKNLKTTYLQGSIFIKGGHSLAIPLFARAIEEIDLSSYEVILSSSHAVAKGVITSPDQIHICYCHSPMRYIWDQKDQYTEIKKGFKSTLAKIAAHYLRIWDVTSSSRVDVFIANSQYVSRRIKKIYNRESIVIYPPVDIEKFYPSERREEFYLVSSRLVEYKRIDLIAKAFSEMRDRHLVIIGSGPELEKIRLLSGSNVQVMGFQADEVLREYMSKCKAFIYAGEEDFGISMVEAQASGAPVIAYSKGGASEIILDGINGLLFNEQKTSSIIEAVEKFEEMSESYKPDNMIKNAQRFSVRNFAEKLKAIVERAYKEDTQMWRI